MTMTGYKFLTIEQRLGVAFVTINRPPINLLDAPLTRELGHLGKALASDEAVSE